MQFIADVTSLEVTVAQMPDCSSLGAAMAMAMARAGARAVGMGVYVGFDELSALRRDLVTYGPRRSAEAGETLLAGWKRAVAQVLRGT
jgi:glycerol kinase